MNKFLLVPIFSKRNRSQNASSWSFIFRMDEGFYTVAGTTDEVLQNCDMVKLIEAETIDQWSSKNDELDLNVLIDTKQRIDKTCEINELALEIRDLRNGRRDNLRFKLEMLVLV